MVFTDNKLCRLKMAIKNHGQLVEGPGRPDQDGLKKFPGGDFLGVPGVLWSLQNPDRQVEKGEKSSPHPAYNSSRAFTGSLPKSNCSGLSSNSFTRTKKLTDSLPSITR